MRIEYQHIVPIAQGGASTAANVTLFCRAHNQLQAEKDFGEGRCRAVSALVKLGYTRKEAEPAVRAAVAQLPGEPDLLTVVTASLRRLAP